MDVTLSAMVDDAARRKLKAWLATNGVSYRDWLEGKIAETVGSVRNGGKK